MSLSEPLRIAIAAVPNSGKTTLFNRLTGTHQTVGNWAGVTVEKKSGRFQLDQYEVELIDLPGAYSLNPGSAEEQVLADFINEAPPELVINVADAGNLYRALGLTLQLAATRIPMVLAVNMMDEARARGLSIDFAALSDHLGMAVVPMVARTAEGVTDLKKAILDTVSGRFPSHPPHLARPALLEEAITDLAGEIEQCGLDDRVIPSLAAEQLLEGGDAAGYLRDRHPQLARLDDSTRERRDRVEKACGQPMAALCAQCRFNSARGLVSEVMGGGGDADATLTRRFDDWLLHPWLGIPFFLLLMWFVFQGVYSVGAPMQDLLSGWVAALQDGLRPLLVGIGIPALLENFLIDGVLEGLGVVLSFFPIIALFFLFLSLIEDSGYMARAAFLMDRTMHMLRLDGKAFINLLLGFGCNVPAVMGTRIQASRQGRVVSMLIIPFSLCSARLQVFLFLASVLFLPGTAAWVLFGLYLTSFAAIVVVGLVLRPFRFGGRPEPFILELPPFRMPAARVVAMRVWQELSAFLRRAATLIVSGVVAVWFLTHFPIDAAPGSEATLAGRIGQSLEFLFAPVGIQWRETVALFFGFIAKEIVVGAMAVIYAAGDSLPQAVASHISPLQGLSFMIFTLLYTPCVATVATIWAESRSWRITLLSISLGLVLAWVASFMVFQGGLLLGLE